MSQNFGDMQFYCLKGNFSARKPTCVVQLMKVGWRDLGRLLTEDHYSFKDHYSPGWRISPVPSYSIQKIMPRPRESSILKVYNSVSQTLMNKEKYIWDETKIKKALLYDPSKFRSIWSLWAKYERKKFEIEQYSNCGKYTTRVWRLLKTWT